MRRRVPALLIALACLAAGPLAHALRDDDDAIAARAKEIVRDPEYQKELAAPAERPDLRVPACGGGCGTVGSLGELLFYVGALVMIALAVTWLAPWLARKLRRAPAAEAPGPTTLAAPAAAAELGEADRYADKGEFVLAVHALFLVAVERVAGGRPPGGRTGRELARELPRNEAERAALRTLAGAVEVSLFGGRPFGAADYARCRDIFREAFA